MELSVVLFFYAVATLVVVLSGPALVMTGWKGLDSLRPTPVKGWLRAGVIGGGIVQVMVVPWVLPVHSVIQAVPAAMLMCVAAGLWYGGHAFSKRGQVAAMLLLAGMVTLSVYWQLHSGLQARHYNAARQAALAETYPNLTARADFDVYVPPRASGTQTDGAFEAAIDGTSQYRMAVRLPGSELSATFREYNMLHTPYPTGNCGMWAKYDPGDCRVWGTTPGGIVLYGDYYKLDKPVYVYVTFGVTRIVLENWRWLDQQKILQIIDTLQPVTASKAPHIDMRAD